MPIDLSPTHREIIAFEFVAELMDHPEGLQQRKVSKVTPAITQKLFIWGSETFKIVFGAYNYHTYRPSFIQIANGGVKNTKIWFDLSWNLT